MLSDGLYYPSRSDDALMTVLIGGVLSILSFLLIPILFVFGYFLRVLEQTVDGVDEPPVFDDWGDLGMSGLLAFVVTVLYYLVPTVVFVVLGGAGALTGSGDVAAAGFAIAALVSGLLFIALTYVYPAAITNFARTGSVGDAFAFGDISSVVVSPDYLVAWVIGFIIFVSGFVVVGVLSLIPILGTIVGVFVNFYIQVAAYRVFGLAFRRAAESEETGISIA
ncbi:MAG: DUF4013 domain-containing protein [Halolamina sp.]|uniref:DUF4013 domain-containing protein n=1 Tax=Halolamina sp. TaxID=1940283 RepID=UPI002FC349AC